MVEPHDQAAPESAQRNIGRLRHSVFCISTRFGHRNGRIIFVDKLSRRGQEFVNFIAGRIARRRPGPIISPLFRAYVYREVVGDQDILVLHFEFHGVRSLFRCRERIFGLIAPLHLLPVDRPGVDGVERIFNLNGPQQDRAPQRYIAGALLDRP